MGFLTETGLQISSPPNQKNEVLEKLPMNTVKPLISTSFGTPMSGVISGFEPTVGGDFRVKIVDIQGGLKTQFKPRSRDVVVYNLSGHKHSAIALQKHIGQRLNFFEAGQFDGFPTGFWKGQSPVATKRKFGFYSSFIFLIPESPNNNDNKLQLNHSSAPKF